jgi:hypothetical protein
MHSVSVEVWPWIGPHALGGVASNPRTSYRGPGYAREMFTGGGVNDLKGLCRYRFPQRSRRG